MQIRRDYSQPFFSDRRRKRSSWKFALVLIALIVGMLFFVDSQFPQLQNMALHAVGQGPAPTAFASTVAEAGYKLFLAGDVAGAAEQFRQAVAWNPCSLGTTRNADCTGVRVSCACPEKPWQPGVQDRP